MHCIARLASKTNTPTHSSWSLLQTVKALKRAAEESATVGGARQVASDLTELYVHAASIKDEFDVLITSLATALGAEIKLPPGLKRMSRAVEKCLFDSETTESCFKICDVVRAMFKTQSMAEVSPSPLDRVSSTC